jgi:hypothetical protein
MSGLRVKKMTKQIGEENIDFVLLCMPKEE